MEPARAGPVPHAWPGALVTSAVRGGEEESRENEVIWNFSENWWKLAEGWQDLNQSCQTSIKRNEII